MHIKNIEGKRYLIHKRVQTPLIQKDSKFYKQGKNGLYEICKFFLTCFTFIFLISGSTFATDRTDNAEFQQQMYEANVQHSYVMDRANECFRATGSYSKLKCYLRERNVNSVLYMN